MLLLKFFKVGVDYFSAEWQLGTVWRKKPSKPHMPHMPSAVCLLYSSDRQSSFIPHNLEFIIRLYLSQVINSIVKEILTSLSFCTKYQNSLMDNKFQCQAGLESPWLLVRPSHPVVHSAYIWGTPHAVAQAADGPNRDGWRGFPPHFLKTHPSLSP